MPQAKPTSLSTETIKHKLQNLYVGQRSNRFKKIENVHIHCLLLQFELLSYCTDFTFRYILFYKLYIMFNSLTHITMTEICVRC